MILASFLNWGFLIFLFLRVVAILTHLFFYTVTSHSHIGTYGFCLFVYI